MKRLRRKSGSGVWVASGPLFDLGKKYAQPRMVKLGFRPHNGNGASLLLVHGCFVFPLFLSERRSAMPVPYREDVRVPEEKLQRRVYVRPAVVCELKLETRAGSALGVDPMLDPLSGWLLKGLGGE